MNARCSRLRVTALAVIAALLPAAAQAQQAGLYDELMTLSGVLN